MPVRSHPWAVAVGAITLALSPTVHASLVWPRDLPEAGRHSAPARDVVVLTVPKSPRVRIPGGVFNMGSTPLEMQLAKNACEAEMLRDECAGREFMLRFEGHIHEVELSPYDLDRTEVTVEAFDRCVAAGACPAPTFARSDPRFARPRLPVTHVTFEAARAYCAFVGGRLPTEAELELAARGPEGRRYPWGRTWNPHLANHGALAQDRTNGRDGFVGLAEVGSFPDGATPQGVLDLAGNVAELASDFFAIDGDGFGYSGKREVDPKGPATGSFHVVRGGSYRDPPPMLRGAAREPAIVLPAPDVGFRCAYAITR